MGKFLTRTATVSISVTSTQVVSMSTTTGMTIAMTTSAFPPLGTSFSIKDEHPIWGVLLKIILVILSSHLAFFLFHLYFPVG